MEKFEQFKAEETPSEEEKISPELEKVESKESVSEITEQEIRDAEVKPYQDPEWKKYWTERLASEIDQLSGPEKQIAEKFIEKKAFAKGEEPYLKRYLTKRFYEAQLKVGGVNEKKIIKNLKRLEQSLEMRAEHLAKTGGPKEKKEARHKAEDKKENLSELIERINKANQFMIGIGQMPIVGRQELKDLEAGSGLSHQYWINRLTPEIDILPEEVQAAIKTKIQGKALSFAENKAFNHYVNKRVAVTKFEISKKLELARLKYRLRDIDAKKNYQEKELAERRKIFFDEAEGKLYTFAGNEKKFITEGDIVADYSWGIKYVPHESVPDNKWRRIRKLADLTQARKRIEHIFNEELINVEGVHTPTTELSLGRIEKKLNEHAMEGVLGERMAQNFLTRVQYNNPQLDFRVEASNVLEDAELKYDFKVVIPEKRRGVAIEGDEMPREEFIETKRRVGIQFIVTKLGRLLRKKTEQITEAAKHIKEEKYTQFVKRPVDDIVLVSLPFKTFKKHFRQWLKEGKPPGGPEQYMTKEEKTRIVKEVFRNFIDLSDEEVEKLVL